MSGGFATVQPGSILSINAVEGYPLEDFSADAVRNQIAEAQKIASGGGSEQDVAEAKIELEVSLEHILPFSIQNWLMFIKGAGEPSSQPEVNCAFHVPTYCIPFAPF